jgi:hypothetical protein
MPMAGRQDDTGSRSVATPGEDRRSTAHRVAHVVGAVVVVVVLPSVLMAVVVGSLGVSAMFVGLVLGVIGAKLGGTHHMGLVASLVGVAAGLGARRPPAIA